MNDTTRRARHALGLAAVASLAVLLAGCVTVTIVQAPSASPPPPTAPPAPSATAVRAVGNACLALAHVATERHEGRETVRLRVSNPGAEERHVPIDALTLYDDAGRSYIAGGGGAVDIRPGGSEPAELTAPAPAPPGQRIVSVALDAPPCPPLMLQLP